MDHTTASSGAAYLPPTKIFNRMFIGVFIANVGLHMGQQMSNSLLSLYAYSLSAPSDQIGLLMSMFAVTALLFRFVAGPAINAFNRKKLVCMGMGFMTVAYLGFSFSSPIANALGASAIDVLKCFRLIQGIGNAFGSACLITIASDALPADQFTEGFSYFACAQVVAQAIGPSMGILLRDAYGYSVTYLINACVMAMAIFITASQVRLAPRAKTKFSMRLSNMIAREALAPAGINILVAMGFTSINAFLLVYAEARGIAGGSLFFTVYAVSMLLTRPLAGKLANRFGFVKVGIPAILSTVASFVMIGFSTNLSMLLAAAFVNAFGYGAIQPALQSICLKSVVPERRGSGSATYSISLDTATIMGPAICGMVAKQAGYTPVMWLVMTLPILLAVVFMVVFRKKLNRIERDFLTRATKSPN